ncbi:MAG: T9SS type A sorting domain-containing protein, partial [Candidatus Cloacimonetes bacterium]|nr:T9SS type A sorting domain-containing protein [Candidatus Cloacimonadota bacterium]
ADKVIETPLFFTHNQTNYIGLAFADNSCIYKVNDSYGLEQIQSFNYGKGKLAFAKETVYFQAVRKLYKMSMKSAEIEVVSLPDIHTKYDPVIYTTLEKELVFMMSDTHKIYRLNDEKVDLIFNLNLFTPEIPSHLAIGYTADFMSCFIVFHTETQIFALSEDGAFLPGFPVRLEKNKLDVASYPYIFRFDGTPLFTLYDTNQGLLSVDINGKIRYEYSHYWAKSDVSPRFFITDIMGEKTLNMVYSDTDNNAYIGTKTLENPSENEILWNGYRNGSTGVLHRAEILIQPDNEKVRVYVYPNPVKSQTGTVRITNSYATAKVRVYNTAGQVVISDTINESIESFRDFRFDTQNLSSGVYFTVVEIEGKTYNEKFAVIK